MMQKGVTIPIVILLLSLVAMPLEAISAEQELHAEATAAFLEGISRYQAGDYDEAINAFRKVTDSGVHNGRLYYNLGNAYLKRDDVGQAMLWYERAYQLIPTDPDLRFNRDYVLTLLKDEREDPHGPLVRILFFWNYALSDATIRWCAIGANAVFWFWLIGRLLLRKRALHTPAYLMLALALALALTAAFNFYNLRYRRDAIILPPKASVRSGLSESDTELFVLHAGTRVTIQREHRGFFRIRFAEGKIGWLPTSSVGVI